MDIEADLLEGVPEAEWLVWRRKTVK